MKEYTSIGEVSADIDQTRSALVFCENLTEGLAPMAEVEVAKAIDFLSLALHSLTAATYIQTRELAGGK